MGPSAYEMTALVDMNVSRRTMEVVMNNFRDAVLALYDSGAVRDLYRLRLRVEDMNEPEWTS